MGYVVQNAIETVREMLEGSEGVHIQLQQMAGDNPDLAIGAAGFAVRPFGLKKGVVADEEFSAEPRVRILVEKLTNRRSLKYAPFSGTSVIALLIDANGDRQDGVASQLNAIADAILLVLDNHVGELNPGIYYGGGYELRMFAIERGGRAFQQRAEVRFELSMDDVGEG